MREILFRGKRIDTGEWVEGYYTLKAVLFGTIEEEIYSTIQPFNDRSYAVDPSSVGQYTGLTDATGKKIFEGDVVQDISMYLIHLEYVKDGEETQEQADKYKNYGKIGVVQYNAEGEVGSCGCCYEKFEGAGFLAYDVVLKQCKVIGNIHDNPELIDK